MTNDSKYFDNYPTTIKKSPTRNFEKGAPLCGVESQKLRGGSRYIREVTNPPLKELKSKGAREIRFELQGAARQILYSFHGEEVPKNKNGYAKHHRTCTCNYKRITNTAQIMNSKKYNKCFFGGVATCANARTCPVCAATINERKANEMRVAANQVPALGLHMSMITFTTPHDSGDRVEDLIPKLSKAHSAFWRGAPAKRFKERYGIVGHIRSFEITHGANGWHPHFHIIVVSKKPLPKTVRTSLGNNKSKAVFMDQQSNDWLWILNRWSTVSLKEGLKLPNEHGLDIQDGSQAGEYITKFGSDDEILQTAKGKDITWDIADEMTKGNTKLGRSKSSRSPWGLLADSIDDSLPDNTRKESRLLFLYYARAVVGFNQIKWSRGLRSLFHLEPEKSDEEILKDENDLASVLCRITPIEWDFVVKNNKRSDLLCIAESEGSKGVARFFYENIPNSSPDFLHYYFNLIGRSDEFFEELCQPINNNSAPADSKKDYYTLDYKEFDVDSFIRDNPDLFPFVRL